MTVRFLAPSALKLRLSILCITAALLAPVLQAQDAGDTSAVSRPHLSNDQLRERDAWFYGIRSCPLAHMPPDARERALAPNITKIDPDRHLALCRRRETSAMRCCAGSFMGTSLRPEKLIPFICTRFWRKRSSFSQRPSAAKLHCNILSMRAILAATLFKYVYSAWEPPLSRTALTRFFLVQDHRSRGLHGLLSTCKLLNDGFLTASTIDGIMHYEISGATPTAALTRAYTREQGRL